jgi:hypothetical protein
VLVVVGSGRPVTSVNRVQAGSSVGCLRVTQTLVGLLADRPEGSPVRSGDPRPMPKSRVSQITVTVRLPSAFEALREPAGLVVVVELWVDALGDHPSAKRPGVLLLIRVSKISETEDGRPRSRWSLMTSSKKRAAGRQPVEHGCLRLRTGGWRARRRRRRAGRRW